MRIGLGYDVHAFASGRDLWLGGIKVPHEKGLQGHSDADVVIHALCDALLGAVAMRDIGYHFPDTKGNEFEGIAIPSLNKSFHERSCSLSNKVILLCGEVRMQSFKREVD